ncbi:hypothetical protein HJFPF1_10567 [Paramyrothecium foliicola]|nr:hypothetical protein HJFPF1_10567 [Paramyrothecium foliicola]
MAPLENDQKQSEWLRIFDPSAYFPILDSILRHLTIADALILCQACKGLSNLKDHLLRKTSNINERLKDFVSHPVQLRSELGHCNALIFGNFALGFFDLTPRKIRELDIVVGVGADSERLKTYLNESEGYQTEAEGPSIPISARSLLDSSNRPGVAIRITETSTAPILHILKSSYTTACVNFLTWNKAFCMFPLDTLIKHRFYPLQNFDDRFGSRLNELARQGWTTRDIIWPDFKREESLKIAKLRRVGDASALSISLNTDGVVVPPVPDSVIQYAQFVVVKDDPTQPRRGAFRHPPGLPSPRGSYLSLGVLEMKSHGVRYVYATGSSSWSTYLGERLRRWAWLEAFKMGTEGTPWRSATNSPLVSEITDFATPETWDFADNQIPIWYKEWEQRI